MDLLNFIYLFCCFELYKVIEYLLNDNEVDINIQDQVFLFLNLEY